MDRVDWSFLFAKIKRTKIDSYDLTSINYQVYICVVPGLSRVNPSLRPLWRFSGLRTPLRSYWAGPITVSDFLVFSGFRNLLEHSGRVFTGSSRFYVCEPVFLSFLVLVFCFFFRFSNLNKFSKLNLKKKIKFWTVLNLNNFESEQNQVWTNLNLNKIKFEQIRIWTNSNLNKFEFKQIWIWTNSSLTIFFEFEHEIRNWTDFELNKF
jgi:hypothetical protein